jgi:hypothetical protein
VSLDMLPSSHELRVRSGTRSNTSSLKASESSRWERIERRTGLPARVTVCSHAPRDPKGDERPREPREPNSAYRCMGRTTKDRTTP